PAFGAAVCASAVRAVISGAEGPNTKLQSRATTTTRPTIADTLPSHLVITHLPPGVRARMAPRAESGRLRSRARDKSCNQKPMDGQHLGRHCPREFWREAASLSR